jgi:hypothetical protein
MLKIPPKAGERGTKGERSCSRRVFFTRRSSPVVEEHQRLAGTTARLGERLVRDEDTGGLAFYFAV